jgi:hypothetical protein
LAVRGRYLLSRVLLAAMLVGAVAAALGWPGSAHADPSCATVAGRSVPPAPTAGNPCWVEVSPYPFGFDGNPVDTTSAQCKPNVGGDVPGCYLTVTSFAFRSWNRGLAATIDLGSANPNTTAFGVWLYNGTRWFPDPTFPGKRICKGSTVLWAGKRDYWLIGPGLTNTWPSLCRFDGSKFEWDPLPVPASVLARVTPPGQTQPSPGAITAGVCAAWNSCWFFGTYGTILRWDGNVLKDVSIDPAMPWLTTAFTTAVLRQDDGGSFFGLAGGGSSPSTLGPPSPSAPNGSAPSEVFSLTDTTETPIPFALPAVPQPHDPYRTDVVALDLDPSGEGWLAGNPAAMRRFDSPLPPPSVRPAPTTPEPAPLVPVAALGQSTSCQGPPPDAFMFTRSPTAQDAYLWSSIGAIPGTGEAFAGGQFRPAISAPHARNDDGQPEPSIEHVGCGEAPMLSRFRIPDPTEPAPGPPVPADRLGATTAVSASAVNDAWAATTRGLLVTPGFQFATEQPRVYQFTDGQPPQAPAGDDNEDRPPELQLDPPIVVFVPLPPPTVVVTTTSTTVTTTTSSTSVVHLGSPIDRVETRLRKLDLIVQFRVKRPVTLGLLALRRRNVVARTRLVRFRRGARRLVLHLDRRHWPTGLKFYTDSPTVTLADPGASLSGTVVLRATAKAIRGRRIASIEYQEAPAGTGKWTTIGIATTAPFTVSFDTTTLENGAYDIQAIARDNREGVAVSAPRTSRTVAN